MSAGALTHARAKTLRQCACRTQPDGAPDGVRRSPPRVGAALARPSALERGQFVGAAAQPRRRGPGLWLGAVRQSRAVGTLSAGPRVGALRRAQSSGTGRAVGRLDGGGNRTGARASGPRATGGCGAQRPGLHRLSVAGGGAGGGRAFREPGFAREFRGGATIVRPRHGGCESGGDAGRPQAGAGRVPRAGLAAGTDRAAGDGALAERGVGNTGHLVVGRNNLSH